MDLVKGMRANARWALTGYQPGMIFQVEFGDGVRRPLTVLAGRGEILVAHPTAPAGEGVVLSRGRHVCTIWVTAGAQDYPIPAGIIYVK